MTMTALAVSLDSMLAGFAVGLKTKFTLKFSAIVAVATLTICCVAMWLGVLIDGFLGEYVHLIGAVFLTAIGVFNFFKKCDGAPSQKLDFKESLALGFAVGLDAGVANLSICLMGYTSYLIPLFFAVMHFAMVSLGFLLAGLPPTRKLKHTNKIAGATLFALGVIRFFQ